MPRVLEAITPLGPKALIFHEMEGQESLSTLFDFTVTLVSEQLGIAPKALLGKPISVSVETEHSGPKRYLNGICTRFALTGRHKLFHIYTAQLKPWLWLATRRSDSKIFQQKKVPDIIESVLGKYNFPIKLKLSGSYRVWDYCVQYHETDYQFVSRLMEHEGIYYYFEHSAGTHTLVLCDGISSHQALAPRSAVNYFGIDATTDAREEHFHTWRPREEIDPGEYLSDDYDFSKPKAELTTKNKAPKGHANDAWERYSWPGGYTEVSDGEFYARTRREALQSEQTRATGEGNLRSLAPGYLMSLARCPRAEQNTEHLIVGITYALKSNTHGMGAVATDGVECIFNTLTQPSSVPYRPQLLTPKPKSQGPQVAIVVGPPGEEIYTDKYGRVKVQFPWDRYGQNNENSSCWMRVSHPWAGSNYGAIHIPRIGQEVIVDHVDGDPDYPIITGRVYNADQMPPWSLPDNKTQSGFLTRSSKGGAPGAGMKATPGDTNAIRFEDKKNEEQLWLHAQKDQLTEVENDEDKWVGRDRRKTIDRDELNHIQRDRTETVDRNETITIHGWRDEEVDGNETITIHSNRKERVDHNETISIGDNRDETVGKSETTKIGINKSDKIGKNWSLKTAKMKTETIGIANIETVGMARMTNIGMGLSVNVGLMMNTLVGIQQSSQIGKKKTLTVGDTYSTTVGKTRTTEVGKSDALKVGKTQRISVGERQQTSVGKVQITSVGDHLELACGAAKIVLTADGGIYLQGTHVEIIGSSAVHADGGMVRINTGAAKSAPSAPAASADNEGGDEDDSSDGEDGGDAPADPAMGRTPDFNPNARRGP